MSQADIDRLLRYFDYVKASSDKRDYDTLHDNALTINYDKRRGAS